MRFGNQTIEILSPGIVEDDYHNEVEDWGDPAPVSVEGCSVQPGVGGKFYDDRAATAVLFTVWAPFSAPATPQSRVRYDGSVYAIDGQVESWPGSHKVIRLKAVAG